MSSDTVVSAIALAVAAGTAWYSRVQAASARRQAKSAERQAAAAERQVDLLREQLAAEDEERTDRRRARVYATQGGSGPAGESVEMDVYQFFVRNAGPSVARNATIWTRRGDADVTPRELAWSALMPGDDSPLTLHRIARAESRSPGLTLWGSWDDEAGPHEEPLLEVEALSR